MKRFVLLLSIVLYMLFMPSCSMQKGDESNINIKSDAGNYYKLVKIDSDSGSADINGLNAYTATTDELRAASIIDDKKQVNAPNDEREAARIGSSVLDEVYEDWSEANTVCVFFNDNANAWIVHGQMIDRNSTKGVGFVVIEADTGEILCTAYSEPS